MKKLILSLVAILGTATASFADTTLSQAYKSLSGLSGMQETYVQSIAIDQNSALKNVKTSAVAASLDNTQAYRSAFIYELENLPVRNIVMGANNMRELATVYATPAGNGMYDVLMITGDSVGGVYSATFGQTDKAGVAAIQNSQLQMNPSALTITPASAVGTQDTFISMNN